MSVELVDGQWGMVWVYADFIAEHDPDIEPPHVGVDEEDGLGLELTVDDALEIARYYSADDGLVTFDFGAEDERNGMAAALVRLAQHVHDIGGVT